MSYEETLEYLDRLAGAGIKLGLESMRGLLRSLGSPQNAVPAVHVAGSNGKGSVAAFLSSILTEGGYRVGLYTSPHLVSVEERIALDGRPISPEQFAAAAAHVRRRGEAARERGEIDRDPTYFEFLTAVAFHVFQREECDLQILETGLGGRLDATNVVDKPLACLITRIDHEHTDHLGDSLEEIAREKAGIARAGVPTLTFETNPDTLAALEEAVRGAGSTLIDVAGECRAEVHEDGALSIRVGRMTFRDLAIPLPGQHQVDNLALALRAIELLASRGYPVEMERLKMGVEMTRWPGRLELVRTNPTVLLDGAHNPAGARALAAYLEEAGADSDLFLVFGAMRDKDFVGMMQSILPRAKKVFLTRSSAKRAAPLDLLQPEAAKLHQDVVAVEEPGAAIDEALSLARERDAVLVAGSLILVGDVKKHLEASG